MAFNSSGCVDDAILVKLLIPDRKMSSFFSEKASVYLSSSTLQNKINIYV